MDLYYFLNCSNSSLLNCVPYVLTCSRANASSVLTYQCALRAHVSTRLACQRVLHTHVPRYLACLRANVSCVLTCLACSRAITLNNKNNFSICFI